jgi:rare lipoprotein A
MNPSTLTAAHRSLAFGTRLKVTNKHNGRTVVVRVNDRGPFIRGRVLDLSRAAAQDIGMMSTGTASICYQVVSAS